MEDNLLDIIDQFHRINEARPRSQVAEIEKIINNIVATYHKDWDKVKLRFAREFLSRTWSGIPIPALSVCGRGTQEIRYSSYLAYFMDWTKPHGLSSRYLDKILSFINQNEIDTYRAVVETEKWLGEAVDRKGTANCFCDIVISTKSHWIMIEQKINSGESANHNSETSQLLRYDMAISNNPEFAGKDIIRIYLTPSGKISQKSPNWISLSYTDLITVGMDTLNAGGLSNIARENLKRFLIDLLLGPFKKAESEIQDLIESAEKSVIGKNFSDRLRFDQLVNRNKLLVNLLMEG